MAASQQPSQGIISQLHKDKAISVLAKSYVRLSLFVNQ